MLNVDFVEYSYWGKVFYAKVHYISAIFLLQAVFLCICIQKMYIMYSMYVHYRLL